MGEVKLYLHVPIFLAHHAFHAIHCIRLFDMQRVADFWYQSVRIEASQFFACMFLLNTFFALSSFLLDSGILTRRHDMITMLRSSFCPSSSLVVSRF